MLLDTLAKLPPDQALEYVRDLRGQGGTAVKTVLASLYDWESAFARPEQREPEGAWRIWFVNAGRGWGKTKTGAEWVRKLVETGRAKRIALVGRTAADVRDVLIEGPSGILNISPSWSRPTYFPSKRLLKWYDQTGREIAEAHCYGAEKPDILRGPEHDAAWADELAAWSYKESWDNLMLGLRRGDDPRVIVTTTPKPTRLIKDLIDRPKTVVTGGSTYENFANLAPAFIDEIIQKYEGTALGEQELHARLLEESEGALWERKWIEDKRVEDHPDLARLVVAIDPAVTSTADSNETGIVVAGSARIGRVLHFYVLEDYSGRFTPNVWAKRSIDALEEFKGDRIIGEVNNGGDLIETVLRNIDSTVPYGKVSASRGKKRRAEPVAQLYEQGRVHHVGIFRDLEDQLCQWEPEHEDVVPNDRLDALVWAITKLNPRQEGSGPMDLSGLDKESAWAEGG